MTSSQFEALLGTLPNGLHDADLTGLDIDYANAVVACRVLIDFSDPADVATEGTCRAARLVFTGVTAIAIDPHAGDHRDGVGLRTSMIDAGLGQPEPELGTRLQAPPDGFLCWIFVTAANSFIRIGALDAHLEWQ